LDIRIDNPAASAADGSAGTTAGMSVAEADGADSIGASTPEVVDALAVARLYGEPLFKLPQDLYIPPDALEVFLEAFQGPLDLLLYLIRRQNFNILDIPLAEVTRQYLDYVEQIRARNLELAADYLLMAAMLIEIKSRMLLPAPKRHDGSEDAGDPRAELVRRLLEYERIKLAALKLDELPQLGRDFYRAEIVPLHQSEPRLPQLLPEELAAAWRDVVKRARLSEHHRITREELSVREVMSQVLRRLQTERFVEFSDLVDARHGLHAVVVTFIAVLELSREWLVDLTQAEPYAPIYVRLAYTPQTH
jgi:segregation and condensation protein A